MSTLLDTLTVDVGDLHDRVGMLQADRARVHESLDEIEADVARIDGEVQGISRLMVTQHAAVMAALDERKHAADHRAETVRRIIDRATSRDVLIFLGVVLVVAIVVYGQAALDSDYIRINTRPGAAEDARADAFGETAILEDLDF